MNITPQYRTLLQQATRLALMLAVVACLGPLAGYAQLIDHQLGDDDILAAVESDLESDDSVPHHLLDVEVREGIVTLGGTCNTLLSKRRAERLVKSLKGVRAVVNRVRVLPSGRTDEQIFVDVQAALRDDPVADKDEIHVKVGAGRVTLSGVVDSFPEKQLTETAVASVRGVTEIDNQIGIVAKQKRRGDEIKAEILRRFELHPFLAEGLIDLDVRDGVVTLNGAVGSGNERDIARLLCWVAGVRDVNGSELAVKAGLDQQRRRDKFTVLRNDVELRRAVEDALLYDPRVREGEIEVRVRYAAVSLFGNVSSLAGKRAAERDAKNTLGVRRVINHLKVRVPTPPDDLELSKRVAQAIKRDAHLADLDLQASSHVGKVYVSGKANTHFEKERAEAVVANVPGALDVVNRITVEAQWQFKPSSDIFEDVERRLRWSPLLDADHITVAVADAKVTLLGTVDTWHERTVATRHAYQAGARHVVNKLDVRSRRNTPPGLRATLVPNQAEYELNDDYRGDGFQRAVAAARNGHDLSRLPSPPATDLVFRLHNDGERPIVVRVGHDMTEFELSLIGNGAVHVPMGRLFVADFRPGRVITIEPGKSFEIPIHSLQYGFRNASDRWYWTKPGQHMLQATLAWPVDAAGINMNAVAATPIELIVKQKEMEQPVDDRISSDQKDGR